MAEGIFGSYLEGKKIGQDLALGQRRLQLTDMALQQAPEDRAYELEQRGMEREDYQYKKGRNSVVDKQTDTFNDLKIAQGAMEYGLSMLPTAQNAAQYNQIIHDVETKFNIDTGLPVFDAEMPPEVFSQFKQDLLYRSEQAKLDLLKQQNEYDTQRDTRQNEFDLSKMGKSHEYNLKEIEANRKNRNQPELVELWDRIKTLPEGDPERESLLNYAEGYENYRYKPYTERTQSVSPSLRHQIREGIRKEWNELLDEDRAKFKGGLDEYLSLREEAELQALGSATGTTGEDSSVTVAPSANGTGGANQPPAPSPSPTPKAEGRTSSPTPKEKAEFSSLAQTPLNEAGFVFRDFKTWDPDKQARFLAVLKQQGNTALLDKMAAFMQREANQPKPISSGEASRMGGNTDPRNFYRDPMEMLNLLRR